MNDKRGFINAGTAITILMLTSVIVIFLYSTTFDTSKIIQSQKGALQEFTATANSKERIYSLLKNNNSFIGKVNYEDLDRSYEVSTVSEEFNEISKSTSSALSFSINNKTDLSISTTLSNVQDSCSYSIKLSHNGNDIPLGTNNYNLTSGEIFNIDSSEFYDTQTQRSNYGDYSLNVLSSNCTVQANVSYKEIKERILEINGEDLKSEIKIKGGSVPEISMKEGGV